MPTVKNAIDGMTMDEKVFAMEYLWHSVSESDGYAPPAWHATVLAEREARIADGRERFIPWDEAKERISAALS